MTVLLDGGGDSLKKIEGIKEVDESGSVGVGRGVKVKVEISADEKTTF